MFDVSVVCSGFSGGLWWPWWFQRSYIWDWRHIRRGWRRRQDVDGLYFDRLACLAVNLTVVTCVMLCADDLANPVEALKAQVALVMQGGKALGRRRFTLVVIFLDHGNLLPFFLLLLRAE